MESEVINVHSFACSGLCVLGYCFLGLGQGRPRHDRVDGSLTMAGLLPPGNITTRRLGRRRAVGSTRGHGAGDET